MSYAWRGHAESAERSVVSGAAEAKTDELLQARRHTSNAKRARARCAQARKQRRIAASTDPQRRSQSTLDLTQGLRFDETYIWRSPLPPFAATAPILGFLLMRNAVILLGISAAYFLASNKALAADSCTGIWLPVLNVCAFGTPPQNIRLDPSDKDHLLTITSPKGKKPQNGDELYKVNLQCETIRTPGLIDWGPFVETSVATSHIIALTPTKLSSSQLPTDAKAAVTVFSVSGDKKSRNVFLNDNCGARFAVSGRDKLFISASANKTSTNQPGPVSSLVGSLIQVALPILPLFSGVGAATTVLKGVSATSDPLKSLYGQLDLGNTVTTSKQLYQGDNVVRTPYSTVVVNLSKIKSVIQDPDLIGPFENIVKDAYTTLQLSNVDAAALAQGCRRFDALMRDRNLSPDDISYGLVLLTQLYGFDQTKTLTCMGKDLALSGLKHDALWKRFGDKPAYAEDDVKAAFFNDDVAPKPPHKDFARIRTTLSFALDALGGYSRSRGKTSAETETYFADTINVVNLPGTPFDGHTAGAKWTRDDFLKKFITADETSVFRIACLTSDTEGDALFLAFTAKPPEQSTFVDDDAVALRIWLNGSGKVGWVTFDQNTDLVEKAVPASRHCGPTLAVKPLPKPPATTDLNSKDKLHSLAGVY